jgi:hypothetical protein
MPSDTMETECVLPDAREVAQQRVDMMPSVKRQNFIDPIDSSLKVA